MKRPVVLALLAVLTAVAVYLLVIRGDEDGATASDRRAAAAEGDRPDRQAPPTPSRPSAPDRNDPGEAVAPSRPAAGDGPVIREREDGTTVRDHRSNVDPDVEWVRPALPHPSRSPVSAAVTSAVMRQVRPVVQACIREIPESAYGASPAVVTRASISIDDQGTLTVLELGPALADIDAAASGDALACIRDAAPRLSTHVDHAAVPSATLSFTIRPRDVRR